jgi:hypothetical protein
MLLYGVPFEKTFTAAGGSCVPGDKNNSKPKV